MYEIHFKHLKQQYVTWPDRNLTTLKHNLTIHINMLQNNSKFSKIGSYFMGKMSSGFPSDDLPLLCFNSVIHGDSWKLM